MFSSKCESSARHCLSGSCTCPETQCMMHLTVCWPTSTSMLRLLASLVSPPPSIKPLCAEPQHPGTSLPWLSVPHSCFGIWIFILQQIEPLLLSLSISHVCMLILFPLCVCPPGLIWVNDLLELRLMCVFEVCPLGGETLLYLILTVWRRLHLLNIFTDPCSWRSLRFTVSLFNIGCHQSLI